MSSQLLRLLGLPKFETIGEFADSLHIRRFVLNKILRRIDRNYKIFPIAKKNGSPRIISAPKRKLRAIQAWILRNILNSLKPSESATAFEKGRNILSHVYPHRFNRYFLIIDLENLFPSISKNRIRMLFKTIGYNEKISKYLSKICSVGNGLPQGGVTSPSLSNLITGQLDRRLIGYTSRIGLTYTRYADDICVSGNDPALIKKSIHRIRKIISNERFVINSKKSRLCGPGNNVSVTGLVKNSVLPKFSIGRKTERKMRAVIYSHFAKNIPDTKYPTEESIKGWISFVRGVDKPKAEKIEKYYLELKKTNARL